MITAMQVKELREKTGLGILECKKALTYTEGDVEAAILYLREQGMKRQNKVDGRAIGEGLICTSVGSDSSKGAIVELNCETDFVARSSEFQQYLESKTEELLDQYKSPKELNETDKDLTDLVAKLKENIKFRRVATFGRYPYIAEYVHTGGKIGVLVGFEDKLPAEVGKDIAMHIAAAGPKYLSKDKVDQSELAQEKDLIMKKLREQGKPDNMIEKISQGQLSKFFKEVCLEEQTFIKDSKKTVKDILSEYKTKVMFFERFQVGK